MTLCIRRCLNPGQVTPSIIETIGEMRRFHLQFHGRSYPPSRDFFGRTSFRQTPLDTARNDQSRTAYYILSVPRVQYGGACVASETYKFSSIGRGLGRSWDGPKNTHRLYLLCIGFLSRPGRFNTWFTLLPSKQREMRPVGRPACPAVDPSVARPSVHSFDRRGF
jgi:hypothetical protein